MAVAVAELAAVRWQACDSELAENRGIDCGVDLRFLDRRCFENLSGVEIDIFASKGEPKPIHLAPVRFTRFNRRLDWINIRMQRPYIAPPGDSPSLRVNVKRTLITVGKDQTQHII